uniref:Uncharacterized protein n=1 Tax=Triticum urartu TaxID=4572 RepID=A0A8R7VDX4_TRIUA
MMFLDGCYLLHYMGMDTDCALLVNRTILSTGPCMQRDIFLLENQLPWLVLEALMGFMKEPPVYDFVTRMAESFNITPDSSTRVSLGGLKQYRPSHLLVLLRYLVGGMPGEDLAEYCYTTSSAIELQEIGIKLTTSNKKWFVADMSVHRGHLFGQLSLTPLVINDYTASWLVNMAAYEACVSATYRSDGFAISSYISLLAMLMDKEEDVHELRLKHLVHSFLSNHELFVFFKGLSRNLRRGNRYFDTMEKIEMFKRGRPVRIAMHRFVYKNFKTIVAVLSIAGVLTGIFRTLMSLKQHQP